MKYQNKNHVYATLYLIRAWILLDGYLRCMILIESWFSLLQLSNIYIFYHVTSFTLEEALIHFIQYGIRGFRANHGFFFSECFLFRVLRSRIFISMAVRSEVIKAKLLCHNKKHYKRSKSSNVLEKSALTTNFRTIEYN